MKAKIGLAVSLAVLLGPIIGQAPDIVIMSPTGVIMIASEFVIGLAIGTVLRFTLAATEAAGEYISMQMGLGMAQIYSADTRSNSALLSRLLYMIAILMFLAVDGHLFLLQIFCESFKTLPIGTFMNANAGLEIAKYASTVFSSGFLIALPIITALLSINLAMGILNRTAPQLSIFSIGFPVSLGVGLFMIMVMMLSYDDTLNGLFEMGMNFNAKIIGLMMPDPTP